jgi:MYXO-CTERM domain-containing protein
MRKAIASAGLAALLSMGIGTAAVAQTDPVEDVQAQAEETADDSDSGNWGLLGLGGLLGLAGLARRGGGGRSSSAPRGGSASRAPRGGYTTDWSSR